MKKGVTSDKAHRIEQLMRSYREAGQRILPRRHSTQIAGLFGHALKSHPLIEKRALHVWDELPYSDAPCVILPKEHAQLLEELRKEMAPEGGVFDEKDQLWEVCKFLYGPYPELLDAIRPYFE